MVVTRVEVESIRSRLKFVFLRGSKLSTIVAGGSTSSHHHPLPARLAFLTSGASGKRTPCCVSVRDAFASNSTSLLSPTGTSLAPPPSCRKLKARRKALPSALRSLARWHGMILLKGQAATLSAQSSTFCGSRLRMSFCKMGATKRPPCSLRKFGASSSTHSQGYSPPS